MKSQAHIFDTWFAAIVLSSRLSSCTSNKLLQEAAERAGQAQAERQLPAYPDDCRKKEDHAPLIELKEETREFLSQLREEDIDLMKHGLDLIRSLRTIGRFMR